MKKHYKQKMTVAQFLSAYEDKIKKNTASKKKKYPRYAIAEEAVIALMKKTKNNTGTRIYALAEMTNNKITWSDLTAATKRLLAEDLIKRVTTGVYVFTSRKRKYS